MFSKLLFCIRVWLVSLAVFWLVNKLRLSSQRWRNVRLRLLYTSGTTQTSVTTKTIIPQTNWLLSNHFFILTETWHKQSKTIKYTSLMLSFEAADLILLTIHYEQHRMFSAVQCVNKNHLWHCTAPLTEHLNILLSLVQKAREREGDTFMLGSSKRCFAGDCWSDGGCWVEASEPWLPADIKKCIRCYRRRHKLTTVTVPDTVSRHDHNRVHLSLHRRQITKFKCRYSEQQWLIYNTVASWNTSQHHIPCRMGKYSTSGVYHDYEHLAINNMLQCTNCKCVHNKCRGTKGSMLQASIFYCTCYSTQYMPSSCICVYHM